jgi:hypothetical protein
VTELAVPLPSKMVLSRLKQFINSDQLKDAPQARTAPYRTLICRPRSDGKYICGGHRGHVGFILQERPLLQTASTPMSAAQTKLQGEHAMSDTVTEIALPTDQLEYGGGRVQMAHPSVGSHVDKGKPSVDPSHKSFDRRLGERHLAAGQPLGHHPEHGIPSPAPYAPHSYIPDP